MELGVTVYLEGDDQREFPGADRVERIIRSENRWGLVVGSLAVFKANELQKAFKSTQWCWYERTVAREPEPLRHVIVPRRDGNVTRVSGNRWQRIETVEDARGPYRSYVIYRDKDIRAVFRHAEVTRDLTLWALEADA